MEEGLVEAQEFQKGLKKMLTALWMKFFIAMGV